MFPYCNQIVIYYASHILLKNILHSVLTLELYNTLKCSPQFELSHHNGFCYFLHTLTILTASMFRKMGGQHVLNVSWRVCSLINFTVKIYGRGDFLATRNVTEEERSGGKASKSYVMEDYWFHHSALKTLEKDPTDVFVAVIPGQSGCSTKVKSMWKVTKSKVT